MSDAPKNSAPTADPVSGAEHESRRDRFHRTLAERADAIKCVRNDIYTLKPWQITVNFGLGIAAIVLLIISTATLGTQLSTVCLIVGMALMLVVIILNFVFGQRAPMGMLQYTAVADGKRHVFRVIGKSRAVYSDGTHTVDIDVNRPASTAPMDMRQLRFDFFADMDVDVRIGKPDKEIFKGTLDVDGKPVKCKIVFRDGVVFSGMIGGARIKYFDVNRTREKFVVPDTLYNAVVAEGIAWPKLDGVTVADSHRDLMKQ